MSQVVSLCFSGNPRAILTHAEAWGRYLSFLRAHYEIRVFFHSWADQALLQTGERGFLEGQYRPGRFSDFDKLIELLKPQAFTIESVSAELEDKIARFPRVFLTGTQAPKRAILSQLYSIEQADRLRQAFEAREGASDVVLKLRFDLVPHLYTINEIAFILTNPDLPVLFAPRPSYHTHVGGGGGCTECHAYFHERFRSDRLRTDLRLYLRNHAWHANDICDLYAFASPMVMREYTSMFGRSRELWQQIERISDLLPASSYEFVPDPARGGEDGTLRHACNMEEDPYFFPEKLIRYNMKECLVIHAETTFLIARR